MYGWEQQSSEKDKTVNHGGHGGTRRIAECRSQIAGGKRRCPGARLGNVAAVQFAIPVTLCSPRGEELD